jgi:hypothetical protein
MANADESGGKERPGFLKQAADYGTIVKTIFGLLATLIAGSAIVYQHFAKTVELEALQCSVARLESINNQVVEASEAVNEALSALKQNLDTPRPTPATTKAVAEELSNTIKKIKAALKTIQDARVKANLASTMGEKKCPIQN